MYHSLFSRETRPQAPPPTVRGKSKFRPPHRPILWGESFSSAPPHLRPLGGKFFFGGAENCFGGADQIFCPPRAVGGNVNP